MPIRINLLAEEQAAEEMRRRDPIKRAIYAGVVAVVLMLAWIVITQMNVVAARSELTANETRLKQLEESSRLVRSNQFQSVDLDTKVKALEKYSTNRFLWGTFLDAVQHASVENIRLMEIRAEQNFKAGDTHKFFITNITVKYTPPPPFWKFWASASTGPSVATLVSNTFKTFTNSAPFTTNVLEYKIGSTPIGTNTSTDEITSKVEFSNVPWAQEEIIVEIRGRDYGNPPGAAIDDFSKRLQNSEFFKHWLEPGRGMRFTERPPQPRPDPQDTLNPTGLFVPFTIELRLRKGFSRMNKLSKEKRDKLILTIISVVGILGILYTYVYGAQKDKLNTYNLQISAAKAKLASAERLARSEEMVARNLAESKRVMEEKARDMAPPGQEFYWFFKFLDEFRKTQGLGTAFIVDMTQPEFSEVGLLPKFQFKAASFGVRINGRFHEVGKFIADLENTYPYFRVQNIRFAPNTVFGQPGADAGGEKLMVELRVVTLLKPSTT